MAKRRKGRRLITGLDVGTTKICTVIVEAGSGGTLNVVGTGMSPSRGLRKGVVVNIHSTVEAIKKAVEDAEREAGVEVESVYAGVAGGHVKGTNSRGVVAVAGKNKEVGRADIERAIDAARAIQLAQGREIIHVLPRGFVVDDQHGIREPLGMCGARLGVDVHVVTGAVTSVQNVVQSVNRAGLTVQDIVLEPLASAEAVLFQDEKDLGVILIDMGGGTTDVALFRESTIWHTAVLPLGGDHVTNDIAVGLRTPAEGAEEIKRRHGCALTALVPEDEAICVPSVGGRKPRELSRQVLSGIVQPRVEEIFTLVAREISSAGLEGAAPAGVVVTGGSSIMEGVPELAAQVFDLPVRRGIPMGVGGLASVVESPIYATGVGLALYGARVRRNGASLEASNGHLLQRISRRMREWFGQVF